MALSTRSNELAELARNLNERKQQISESELKCKDLMAKLVTVNEFFP